MTSNRTVAAIAALAIGTSALASEPSLRTSPNFALELIYAVPRDEQGSWISLAIDRQNNLYASDQKGPLYQLRTNGECHRLDLPIGGVHGMSWLAGDLYAVVGERDVCQTGLYRLRDTNADGILDNVRLLTALEGSGEHGPHTVIPSADQRSLYVLAGNATRLPPLTKSRFARMPTGESLLPALPAHMGSESRGQTHGGWICRTNLDGSEWELFSFGLRNAYALAANAEGELFTADSDTEFEYGLPWYRPNRVLHCASGADFGWRSGALKPPENAAELTPAIASLGAGSPSAILFGATAGSPSSVQAIQFPARYRQALFVGDWSHGRLLAVHLTPNGSSYTGTVEEIATGRPLPIAAACISPRDGKLYFVTGGRNTDSHVYRLSWR
jgi:glucose/arabinose dehydrogenase